MSDAELIHDWWENEKGLKTCREALSVGIRFYRSGESIQEYVQLGTAIKTLIEQELDRRGLEIQ